MINTAGNHKQTKATVTKLGTNVASDVFLRLTQAFVLHSEVAEFKSKHLIWTL